MSFRDTSQPSVGKIQRVPLREVWRHEALDFTAWLQENIDVVSEALNLYLEEVEREQAAGDFSVDLVARDGSGDPVIIENQLERSNHDHLGKLLTYLVAFDAKTAVWIVPEARPEHVSTIAWLNESSPASFYLLKVEAVRIGDSPPAPLLTPVVGPSEESRIVGRKKNELAEQDNVLTRFWERLLDKASERTTLHGSTSPNRANWIETSAGVGGVIYSYAVRRHDARVELYIYRNGDMEQTKAFFDALAEDRETIEASFGEPLSWERKDGTIACKIAKYINVGGYSDDNWDSLQETMIESMVRLEAALRPHISKLKGH